MKKLALIVAIVSVSTTANAYGSHVHTLTSADLDGSMGDCGTYLERGNNLVFADTGQAYIKIDGKVHKLTLDEDQTTKSVQRYGGGTELHVEIETQRVKTVGPELAHVAGTLKVTGSGWTETIRVRGTEGC